MPKYHELLQAKHEAVRAYREATDDEGRAKAWAGVDAAAEALDTALTDAAEARDDEARIVAAEAREAELRKGEAVKPIDRNGGLPVDAIRAFAKGEGPGVNVTMPIELRTDITSEASATYASYLEPQSWASSVVDFQIASSGVLKAGPTIITTASGNQINMPKLVTDASGAAGAQGTAATQTNPVWGTTPLNAYRFDGFFSVANEVLADSGVDLAPLLRKYAGRALAALINPYFADPDVGTGSSTIAAVQVGTTTGKTSALSTTTNLDDWKELMYSVLPEYRMSGNCAWVANSAETLAMALRRDDTGNYIWQPSNMAAEPDRLWGYPWYEDAYMDSTASGNEPGFFGDLSSAYIVRYGHGGMQFIVSKEFAVTSFETTFVFGVWVDAATVDTLAVKSLLMT